MLCWSRVRKHHEHNNTINTRHLSKQNHTHKAINMSPDRCVSPSSPSAGAVGHHHGALTVWGKVVLFRQSAHFSWVSVRTMHMWQHGVWTNTKFGNTLTHVVSATNTP